MTSISNAREIARAILAEDLESPDGLQKAARERLSTSIHGPGADTMTTIMAETKEKEVEQKLMEVAQNGGSPEEFLRLHAELDLLRGELAKLRGNAMPLVSMALSPANEATTETPAPGPSFADLVEQHSKEQRLKNKWTQKSDKDNTAVFGVLSDLLPKGPASALTRADFMRVAEQLSRYPSNATKRFPGKSPSELIAMDLTDTLSDTTINKYLVRLSTICKWASQNGLIEKNLAENLQRQARGPQNQERDSFTLDQLRQILAHIATGDTKPGPRGSVRAFHYWMPLMSYYTGARVNELASLRRQDIIEAEGVLCFNIYQQDDGERGTKTASGVRIIPVHPELIRLGFLEYVEGRDGLLFDGLKLTGNGYGDLVSRWFNGHPFKERGMVPRAGITQDKLTYHSIRHTTTTELERAAIPETVIQRLIGHKFESVTFGRYSKGLTPAHLYEVVCALPVISDTMMHYPEWAERHQPDTASAK